MGGAEQLICSSDALVTDARGDSSIAALMAKLDEIEEATEQLNQQNSELRLERTFLRERNDATVRECSAMVGGDAAKHLYPEPTRHLSPDESRLLAEAMRATVQGGDEGMLELRNAERDMQEQAQEIADLLRENEQLKERFVTSGRAPPLALRSAPPGIRATLDARAATLEEEIAQLERRMARVAGPRRHD